MQHLQYIPTIRKNKYFLKLIPSNGWAHRHHKGGKVGASEAKPESCTVPTSPATCHLAEIIECPQSRDERLEHPISHLGDLNKSQNSVRRSTSFRRLTKRKASRKRNAMELQRDTTKPQLISELG